MSKGGGSSKVDTSYQREAADKAIALQERMYEEAVQRSEPFYQAGANALATLSDYLGLGTGTTSAPQMTEQQLLEIYTPQFMESRQEIFETPQFTNEWGQGVQFTGGTDTQTRTIQELDQEGLNAKIQEVMAQQAQAQDVERPDYFGSLLEPYSMDKFEADPSYQFRQEEGRKATERALAAAGKTFSPEAISALDTRAQNIASTEYGAAYDRYRAGQSDIYNRLANLAGVGQTQTSALQQAGQQYAGNVGQTYASLADAETAAQQAKAQGKRSMWGTLGTIAGGIGGAMIGGPQGAMIGANIGGSLGGGY